MENHSKKYIYSLKNQLYMKKTLLITWGLGYIGSHAVVAFEEAGYQTVIVDNLSNTTLKQLDGIEQILWYRPDFFEVDLREQEKLEEIFKQYSFDGVIHFAGWKAVGESCEKPLSYFDNNIIGSLRLFECMEKFKIKKIIFSSSATVYKELRVESWESRQKKSEHTNQKWENVGMQYFASWWNEKWLIETDHVGDCSNPYGTTKFLLEQILSDLAQFSWFEVMNLRYFNPIGAHERGCIWEDPQWIPNNLLPYIMKVATGELEKLYIFGDDYDTRDGTGIRDYIDIHDLIEGHVLAYEKLSKKAPPQSPSKSGKKNTWWVFESYNLWVGRGVSVLEMVDVARKVTGKKIPYEIVGRRDGDLAEVYCDPSKAREELWWEVKVSLEESVRRGWKFYGR